jgi:hypothetical protein
MEDYGADLDGIKRKLAEREVAPATSRLELRPNRAVLANKGNPLLDMPESSADGAAAGATLLHPVVGTTATPPAARAYHTAPSSPMDHSDILSNQWVSMASLYMEGNAAMWYQAHKRRHGVQVWSLFMVAVLDEFGQDEYDGQMSKLMQLRQTGTVAEYRQSFEDCMYHLLVVDETLSSRWFVSQFVFGLRDDIRAAVRLQAPTSIARATSLARIQEEEVEHHRPRARPLAPTRHPPGVATTPNTVAAPWVDWPRKQGNDDFNRERQLRDFRRANNLCFKCGDKYSKEHQLRELGNC